MTAIDFGKNGGLVPAILQDYRTNQVLMLGYMNEEAYELTVSEGVAWFIHVLKAVFGKRAKLQATCKKW